jgi:hypothetical protein
MAPHTGRYVCYYRGSTQKQGRSGFGVEAQREAVQNYLNGGKWLIAAEFTEVESGKKSERPAFAKALAACRLHRATLVIAKLDRLARNVHFVTSLMNSGVNFVAIDHPHANKFTVHVLAGMSEHKGEMISARRAALVADLAPIIAELRAEGVTSLRGIAAGLNARGIPTARGASAWQPVQVARVLAVLDRPPDRRAHPSLRVLQRRTH